MSNNSKQEEQWTPPFPLRKIGKKKVIYPINALPDSLRNYVLAVAENTDTDPAMAATQLIVANCFPLSGVYRVEGKPGHTEPINLFSLTIASPSAMKSPINAYASKALEAFNSRYNKENAETFYINKAKKEVLGNRITSLKRSKRCDKEELALLMKEYDSIRNDEPRIIFADDVTPQMLAHLLKKYLTLIILSAESGLLGNFSGRYDKVPNLDLLLKSFNGELYINSTISHGTIELKKPYVTMGLMTQPYMWDNMFANEAFRGSGLLARMIYCFPDEQFQRRYDTEAIPDEVVNCYESVLEKMLENKYRQLDQGELEEQIIRLSYEAKKRYIEFFNSIQQQMREALMSCLDWAGKYHGLVLRLAGLIHCIKRYSVGEKPENALITLETMNSAIEIGEYYKEQAIYAYTIGQQGLMATKAEDLIMKVKKEKIDQIRQNDLLHHVHCKHYPDSKSLNEVIEFLIDFNFVKRKIIEAANGGNKWGYLLNFNPYIFK